VEILDLGGASEENIPPRLKSRRNKKLKIAAGIGSLAAVTGLGSTLAASITLNNNGPVEFGQGVATTAACNGEESITLTPTSEYVPSTESFRLSGVTLSGINTDQPDPYTGIGCAGKTLIVHAYTDEDGYASFAVGGDKANPLYFTSVDGDFYNSAFAIHLDATTGAVDNVYVYTRDGTGTEGYFTGGTNDFSDPWDLNDETATSGSATVTFGHQENEGINSGLDSRAVSKFTVESIDTPSGGLASAGDWYSIY